MDLVWEAESVDGRQSAVAVFFSGVLRPAGPSTFCPTELAESERRPLLGAGCLLVGREHICGFRAEVKQLNGVLVAQQGVAVREIVEMVIEAGLAADFRVERKDRAVGVEDELSEPTSGVDQPDDRLISVGRIKQLIVIDLCEERHEAIVSAIPRVNMRRRIRHLLQTGTYSDPK